MVQQVQELINKIKSEGIEAAEGKARDIEAQAHRKAQQIVQDAQKQAEQILAKANEEIKKNENASRMALQQSSRDMLLKLKKEINSILNKIVQQQVSGALTPENLSQIIESTIKSYFKASSGEHDVRVSLSPADCEKLKHGFIAKLQKEIKDPIKFQSSEDINKGFSISFDGGKSSFDFSDTAVAEYLGSYLNQEVANLLKESAG